MGESDKSGIIGSILGFLSILLIVAIMLLLTLKLVSGRWFGKNGGFIKPSAINQEIVAVINGAVYNKITPKAANVYITLEEPVAGVTAPDKVDISTKFFSRGMIIHVTNDIGESIETNFDVEFPSGTSVWIVRQGTRGFELFPFDSLI